MSSHPNTHIFSFNLSLNAPWFEEVAFEKNTMYFTLVLVFHLCFKYHPKTLLFCELLALTRWPHIFLYFSLTECQKSCSHPMTPHFLSLCSHRMQWRSQRGAGGGGGGDRPLWQKLCPPSCPPNEITFCTEVYGEPPFWVPVSPPAHPSAPLAAPSFWKVWLRPWPNAPACWRAGLTPVSTSYLTAPRGYFP